MDKRVRMLVMWYAKQPEEIRLEVHARQIEIRRAYHNDCRMRQEKPETSPANECNQFMQAINAVLRLQSNRRLSTYNDLNAVDEKRIAQAKAGTRRDAPKRDKLLQDLRPVVERLRFEGVSWQGVSDFLAKHHKKKISRGYLQRVFQDQISTGTCL
ncbi:MAG: hypothetical protein HXX11_23345 [Desulfuromonadales bacterium]|nr:hypothetical protein [Desulfuromonadales bacterium]